MASNIEVTADVDDGFDERALRTALAALTDDDLSASSPVSPGAPEVAVDHNSDDGIVHVRCEGHDGDFTKTTQRALVRTVRGMSGVIEASVTAGGYDG